MLSAPPKPSRHAIYEREVELNDSSDAPRIIPIAEESKQGNEYIERDGNLTCGQLLDLRKKREHQKMLAQALMTDKKKQFTPVDVTMTIQDLDYINALDGSFMIKFKLHATYVFDEKQRKKDDEGEESKERVSVDHHDEGNSIAQTAITQEYKDSLKKEEEERARVDRGAFKNPSNIFNKLYFDKAKADPSSSKRQTKRSAVRVELEDRATQYVSYNLTEEEVALYMKYYEVPVIMVTNYKLKDGEGDPEWTADNRIALYHVGARPDKEGLGGCLNIMWTRDYEFTCKEMFELHNFPFDFQELTVDLALDGSSPFALQINDMRFWKTALSSNEWNPCQPIVKWKTPHRSNVICRVSRQSDYYVETVAGTITMLAYLGLISFAAEISDLGTRVSNLFTLILTAIAFKLVLGSELPRTSYNTLMDIFVLGCTFILAFMSIACIIPNQILGYDLGDKDNDEVARHTNRYLCYGFAAIITIFAIGWLVGSHIKVARTHPPNCARIQFDYNAAADYTHFFDVQYKEVAIRKDNSKDGKISGFYKEGACVERQKLVIKAEVLKDGDKLRSSTGSIY